MSAEVQTIDHERNVKQSNNLTVSRYKLNLLEQRILFAICSQLKRNDEDFSKIRLSVAELADFCHIEGKNKYFKIRSISNNLMRKLVTIPTADGGEYTTHWLQSRRYYPADCEIEFKLDSELRGELLQLRAAYIDTPASILMAFSKAYSARMYLILKKMQRVANFEYKLDFFREKFELGKTYDQFSNLKNGVLEPALAEINQKSDISVQHEYVKEGRSFTKIRFTLSTNTNVIGKPQSKHPTKRKALDNESQSMLERLMNPGRWDLTEDVARKMIKKHGLARLDNNIRYAYKYRDGKHNLGGWLVSCIENDAAGKRNERVQAALAAGKRQRDKAAERIESRNRPIIGSAIPTPEPEPKIETSTGEIAGVVVNMIIKSVHAGKPVSMVCQKQLDRYGLTVEDVLAGKRK